MTRGAAALVAVAAAVAPTAARAQTMLDQEDRLIDIHSLLVDLPPVQAPAALAGRTLDASLEVVTIPFIDGATGSRRQITASDLTRIFPRPRVMLGLPLPAPFRSFAGLSAIPPVPIRDVSTSDVAAEAGIGAAPGALRFGVRGHAVYAVSRAPVTDPSTRDTLESGLWGADVSAGVHLARAALAVEPYAGAGVVALRGRFRVTSDGTVLRSAWAGAALHAGVRVVVRSRWEIVAEVDDYPGRLVHTNVRLGWLVGL